MLKKIRLFSLALVGILFFSGCANKTNQNETPVADNTENNNSVAINAIETSSGNTQSGNSTFLNSCQEEKVSLPDYDDPGKRLKNCFVEYPGEPSRQDKSYYIIEDICGQFNQRFMENMLGAKLTKIEPPQIATINNCTYFFDDKKNVMLNLEYLAVENQKKGNEAIGYKVKKNTQIPMENMVAWQENDLINAIFLVLSPNKFISLRLSSKNAINNDKFLELAANIATAIKAYK